MNDLLHRLGPVIGCCVLGISAFWLVKGDSLKSFQAVLVSCVGDSNRFRLLKNCSVQRSQE